jgi:hypothetical protein
MYAVTTLSHYQTTHQYLRQLAGLKASHPIENCLPSSSNYCCCICPAGSARNTSRYGRHSVWIIIQFSEPSARPLSKKKPSKAVSHRNSLTDCMLHRRMPVLSYLFTTHPPATSRMPASKFITDHSPLSGPALMLSRLLKAVGWRKIHAVYLGLTMQRLLYWTSSKA